MKPNVAIVTLSKYSEVFEGLQENLNRYASGRDRVLVKDGYLIDSDKDWLTLQGPEGKFVFSVNANIGLKAADPEADILLIGDDVRLVNEGLVENLHALAYSDENIGLLSPRINGGADNPLQMNPPSDQVLVHSERYIALVATYIKRKVFDAIGYLDERFSEGWGWDDVDFSRRARLAGFSLAVTSRFEVIHGLKKRGSETLIRNEKGDAKAMQKQDDINALAYFNKWGDNVK